jgi:hypothetical protein
MSHFNNDLIKYAAEYVIKTIMSKLQKEMEWFGQSCFMLKIKR